MGLYDTITIHSKWLPEGIKQHNEGWQSKDLECLLNEYTIDVDGHVFLTEECKRALNVKINYWGELIFYKKINDSLYRFTANFIRGELFSLNHKITNNNWK